jgi:hypothetical protein
VSPGLPLFADLSPSDLDACLADLDRALDAVFLHDLEGALDRASGAGLCDLPAQEQESSAALATRRAI